MSDPMETLTSKSAGTAEKADTVTGMSDTQIAQLDPKLIAEIRGQFKQAEDNLKKAPQYEEVQERGQQYHEQADRLAKAGRGGR